MQHDDPYHPESEFTEGRFQGMSWFYPPGMNPMLVVSISGRIYAIDVINYYNVLDVTPPDGPNSSIRPQAWFTQAEDWLIIQDGESAAIIFNGVTSRRSLGPAGKEVPTGTAMAYGMGRLWVARGKQFLAGDAFGGSSGTPTYQYRDAVLKFTENTYLNGGGSFSLPLSAGEITAMKFTAQIDTAQGQGELLVGTSDAIFSVHVPVDRTQWQNLTAPIQRIALLKYGPSTQNAFECVNSDYIFRAQDGVRSFVIGKRDFNSYGNVPISREVSRVLRNDEHRLLRYASAVLFDQRLLMTAAPHQVSGRGVYHRGLVVLDFDPLSSMDDKTPPEWDGLWTGINILQLTTLKVRDEERCFAMVLSACDTLELWEITKDHKFDNEENRVTWMLEPPSYTWDNPFQWKSLQSGDLWTDRLTGTVDFDIDFRSDQYPGWVDWHSWSECADYRDCYGGTYGVCRTIPQFAEQYRPRARLPQPPDFCDETFPKRHRDGYEFQPRLTITGFCRLRQMRLHASVENEIEVACQPVGVCKTLSVCPADDFTFASDTCDDPYIPPEPPPPVPAPSDCPECEDCSGWEGDPFEGPTLAANFTRVGASSNYLQMASDTSLPEPFLPANTSFTMGGHFWFDELPPSGSSDLIARYTGGGNESFILGYSVADVKFYFVIIDAVGNPSTTLLPSTTQGDVVGNWYHVVASYDATLGKLRIWINGVQTSINHGAGMRTVNAGVILGNRGGAGTSFDGKMETVFFHRGMVWSDAAVGVLFNGGLGVRASRWLHYQLPIPTMIWEFEDAGNVGENYFGNTAFDLANSDNAAHDSGLVTLSAGLDYS